jgi:hypothetical protein
VVALKIVIQNCKIFISAAITNFAFVKLLFLPLAAWSSGIVSACHRGDWSQGS